MPGGPDREREIQREIEEHLELEAEALQRGDEPLSDARRRARLAFGNPATVQEDVRAVWAWVWLERLIYDVRHAVRLWMASPALAGVAILTMALGIGASTAIVGQINAVFWTPLSVTAPQQLRQVIWSAPRFPYVAGGAVNVLPGPDVDGAQTLGSFSTRRTKRCGTSRRPFRIWPAGPISARRGRWRSAGSASARSSSCRATTSAPSG